MRKHTLRFPVSLSINPTPSTMKSSRFKAVTTSLIILAVLVVGGVTLENTVKKASYPEGTRVLDQDVLVFTDFQAAYTGTLVFFLASKNNPEAPLLAKTWNKKWGPDYLLDAAEGTHFVAVPCDRTRNFGDDPMCETFGAYRLLDGKYAGSIVHTSAEGMMERSH